MLGLIVLVLSAAINVVTIAAPANTLAAKTFLSLAAFVVSLVLWFVIYRKGYGLTRKGACAVLGSQLLLSVLTTVGAILVLKPYAVEAFYLPTRSMEPTLAPGDRFIVNKLLTPRRWDLVAYRSNDQPPSVYIKRLVGLPGERLRIAAGTLYVNDLPVAPPAVVAGRYRLSGPMIRYREGEDIQLKSDEYFVMGDNVNQSKDSRYDGPTTHADLVGVADWLYWPAFRTTILR